MIFAAFFKAIGQLPDPRFRAVLWRGIGLTIALLIGVYAGLLLLIEWLTNEPILLPGGREITWLGDLLGWGSLALMRTLSVFLMIPVASIITSLFLDEVADAVEAKHYPPMSGTPGVGFYAGLKDTVNFLGVLILANVLALLLYAMLPFAAVFIFFAMNGYLLGREYFQLAAMRHIGRAGARELRRAHWGTIWFAGCLMAVPLSVPFINLLIPILGAATFTHIFHMLDAQASRG